MQIFLPFLIFEKNRLSCHIFCFLWKDADYPALLWFFEERKKKLSRHLFMKCEKDADFPALLEFIEKAGCLPYSIMIWNKDADCPTLLDFLEKAGCLPYLIMIWNKDADCPTLLGFVEEKEIYCFGITKEFFYRGRTRVDTYTVDNEGRKKRQRQLLLKTMHFLWQKPRWWVFTDVKENNCFWSTSFHWRNWRHGKNYRLTSRRTISQGEQKFWKQPYRYCRW